MKIVTAAQMIKLDQRTIKELGVSEKKLIHQAGKASAQWIFKRYLPASRQILIVAGKGNNGADVIVTGKELKALGYSVKVIRAWEANAKGILQNEIRRSSNLHFYTLVLDGLFGTGLNRPLREPFLTIVEMLNSSNLEIISLDLPSGLHADTGKPLGASIRAKHTLTFGLPKLGLIQEHAADFVGELAVLDIGFPDDLIKEIQTPYHLITPKNVAPFFSPRRRSVHKGDLGHVLVVGGSRGLVGAPVLAARAALRAGAGLVNLVVPDSIYSIASSLAGPEVMVHSLKDRGKGYFNPSSFSEVKSLLSSATTVVLGPGIGRAVETQSFVKELIRSSPVRMVLDADALHAVANELLILRKAKHDLILTPHPGEMGRLTGLTSKEVQQNRFEIAESFVKKEKVTLILKGAHTVVAYPQLFRPTHPSKEDFQGAGFRFSVNALAGNPGMATAGCGDVLAGILGALLARRIPTGDAAIAGVYLHAKAGDFALPETGGGIASDLIEALPKVQGFIGVKV